MGSNLKLGIIWPLSQLPTTERYRALLFIWLDIIKQNAMRSEVVDFIVVAHRCAATAIL